MNCVKYNVDRMNQLEALLKNGELTKKQLMKELRLNLHDMDHLIFCATWHLKIYEYEGPNKTFYGLLKNE